MTSVFTVAKDTTRALLRGAFDPRLSLGRKLLVFGGFLASGFRLAAGTVVGPLGPRPALRLRLWDDERCPHCRVVREALSRLDLEAEVRPCPEQGTRFRGELNGQAAPQLEDPNTGEKLVGAAAIVAHLHRHYGASGAPGFINTTIVRVISGFAARVVTGHRGGVARPSRAPAQPLELWSFESSPFSRLSRFTLSELELPYVLHNVAKGSPSRRAFVATSGKMQVPYLFDPNTNTRLFESRDIDAYLEQTYGAPAPAS